MSTPIHLHVHSQYTFLGGTASVVELAQRAARDGMSHLALTDRDGLYGAVVFSRACRESGVQPIVGMTTVIAPPQDLQALLHERDASGHGVLLAMNRAGYRSLCRLSTLLQGHPDREERVARGLSLDDLDQHREGLIWLGGGRRGRVERMLRAGHVPAARQYAAQLAGIFGSHAFLSLELHRADDVAVAHQVEALAGSIGLSTVAVQPVYCLNRQDAPRLRLLAAIDHNCTLAQVPPSALPDEGQPGVDLHWLGPDEMSRRFSPLPAALSRTCQVAASCQEALPDGELLFPALDLPHGQSPEAALADLARAGLAERYGREPPARVCQRLEREVATISRHGYAPLFLIVADIVRFARCSDIPVSTRGSVANSLVAYSTGITTVDPVANDLLFERFLSPARTGGSASDAPDIDLDFCSRRRDEVLDYVRVRYGEDRTSLVATVSTLQLRSAVRETAKAFGLQRAQIEALTSRLPRGWHPDPRRRDRRTLADLLPEIQDPLSRQVIQEAAPLVGTPRHLSVHPGGTVITPGPLTDVLPVQWSPKGFLITQFDHQDVEALGLPKLDLLGIRALSVLSDAADLVRRDHDPGFRLDGIPAQDPSVAEMLAQGDTVGVFQCESAGMRSTLVKLGARRTYDLAVANAFFKPGPSLGGMAHSFVRRYRGLEPVTYLHPALEPILGPTHGVLIFQEQLLRIAVEIAGLSWAQADQLRRGVKFRAEVMDGIETLFVRGCQRPPPDGPGFTSQQAQSLWEQITPFSGYGFNQGHAMAYAEVSYRSAYVKAHWPAAFLCARLMNWGGFHHPAMYMAEAVSLGIAVRPPHVNRSERSFSLAWEGSQAVLWMGLGWVRDLRRSAVQAIVAERQRRPFASLRDLAMRVDLQAKEMGHLVQCGALDGLGESRQALLAQGRELQRAESALQLAFDWQRPPVRPEPLGQRLEWECHLLGYPLSALCEPLALVRDRLPDHLALRHLPQAGGKRVTAAGVRLPGWTGGRGFYLWDGETWAIVRAGRSSKAPPPWVPLLLHGRWSGDEWGFSWFQAHDVQVLETGSPR